MDPTTLIVNNLAAEAQRASPAERGVKVHALCDALLSASPAILSSYLPMVVDFTTDSNAAARQTSCIFFGLLLSRDTFRILSNIDVLTRLLADVSPDVVEAAAGALIGLFRPAFGSVMQQPTPDMFRCWEAVHSSCRYAIAPFLRPQLHAGARRALFNLLIQAAAVCAPPFMPPPSTPQDDLIVACNDINITILPSMLGMNIEIARASAERLLSVDIASLFRDNNEARASMGPADYGYMAQKLARLAIWRPPLAEACARALRVLVTIPPCHVSMMVGTTLALRAETAAPVRTALVEAVSYVPVSSAAQAFSSLLSYLNANSNALGTAARLRCPATKPLVLNPDLVSKLTAQEVIDVVMANVPNPPASDVMSGLLSSGAGAAAFEALVGSMQAAQEEEDRIRAEQEEKDRKEKEEAEAKAKAEGDKGRPKEAAAAAQPEPTLTLTWASPGALQPAASTVSDALARLLALVSHAVSASTASKSKEAQARQRSAILGHDGQATADSIVTATSLIVPGRGAAGAAGQPEADPASLEDVGLAAIKRLLSAAAPKDGHIQSSQLHNLTSLLVTVIHRSFMAQPGHGGHARPAALVAIAGALEAARKAGTASMEAEETAIDALARLLLDVPGVDWPVALSMLLQPPPPKDQDGQMADEDEDKAFPYRLAVGVIDQVLPLRPMARVVAMEGLLSLMMSQNVDVEVADGVQDCLGRRLPELDEATRQHAAGIAVAALAAAQRRPEENAGEQDRKRQKREEDSGEGSDSGRPEVFSTALGQSLPACKEAAGLLGQDEVTPAQSLSLLRTFLAVAQGIPSLLRHILPWACAQQAQAQAEGADLRALATQYGLVLTAVRSIATRFGLVPTLHHLVGTEPIPTLALGLVKGVVEALADAGITSFTAAAKRQQESAADSAEVNTEEQEQAGAKSHPIEDASLQALIAAVRELRVEVLEPQPQPQPADTAAEAEAQPEEEQKVSVVPAHILMAPVLPLTKAEDLPGVLGRVLGQASPGDVRYSVQRLLHTPGCPCPTTPDHVFALVVEAADAIHARTDLDVPGQVRLLTEASAVLFEDRGVYTDRAVQDGLQRIVADTVDLARKQPGKPAVLPVLAMRCFAVAVQTYPELRSVLVELLQGILRAVGTAVFEDHGAVASWPAEEAVAAGPRWHGFTRLIKLTLPISYSWLLVLPEPFAKLLLTAKPEAELRRRAVKWFQGLQPQVRDSAPKHLHTLLAPDAAS